VVYVGCWSSFGWLRTPGPSPGGAAFAFPPAACFCFPLAAFSLLAEVVPRVSFIYAFFSGLLSCSVCVFCPSFFSMCVLSLGLPHACLVLPVRQTVEVPAHPSITCLPWDNMPVWTTDYRTACPITLYSVYMRTEYYQCG